jgi:hypothetical protein
MTVKEFKGQKIPCGMIFDPTLTGCVGHPELTKTIIRCLKEDHSGLKWYELDGDVKEDFYDWTKKNGLEYRVFGDDETHAFTDGSVYTKTKRMNAQNSVNRTQETLA